MTRTYYNSPMLCLHKATNYMCYIYVRPVYINLVQCIGATLYVTVVTCHTTFESGGDCHHHFFKVKLAIFQAILSFTILQFYAQRCNCKLTSRQAVPTVSLKSKGGYMARVGN